MPVKANQQATLTAGEFKLLHRARLQSCRLVLTGSSGEGTTVVFKTKKFGALNSQPFEASQVKLSFIQTMPSAQILATTPEGVATLDIVYEVRTGSDI
jgi:hypothetical protein